MISTVIFHISSFKSTIGNSFMEQNTLKMFSMPAGTVKIQIYLAQLQHTNSIQLYLGTSWNWLISQDKLYKIPLLWPVNNKRHRQHERDLHETWLKSLNKLLAFFQPSLECTDPGLTFKATHLPCCLCSAQSCWSHSVCGLQSKATWDESLKKTERIICGTIRSYLRASLRKQTYFW